MDEVADITVLSDLSISSILPCLEARYNQKQVYTWVGHLLLSINPNTSRCEELYSDQVKSDFFKKRLYGCSPHVFAVAEHLRTSIWTRSGTATAIVSGHSGSGKTVVSQLITDYLAWASCKTRGDRAREAVIEARLAQSHIVLESVGNAHTTNNDNSSRFGRLTSIGFSRQSGIGNRDHLVINGACIQSCLLACSRAAHVAPGEQNFHVFYTWAAQHEENYRWKLLGGRDTFVTYFSKAQIDQSLQLCLFTESEIGEFWEMIHTMLCLGEVDFTSDANSSKALHMIRWCAKMLRLEPGELTASLTTVPILEHSRTLSPVEANYVRDATIKYIYQRLFDWTVNKVNDSLNMGGNEEGRYVQMLDIYGFESEVENGFEQFCINYANERLQQQFLQALLVEEVAMYRHEGIRAELRILEILEAPPGTLRTDGTQILEEFADSLSSSTEARLSQIKHIFNLLHDSSFGPLEEIQRTEVFTKNVHKLLYSSNSKRIYKPDFVYIHYAGPILYQTSVSSFLNENENQIHLHQDFVRDNRDNLPRHVKKLLSSDAGPACLRVGEGLLPSKGDRKSKSIGLAFAAKVNDLCAQLTQTSTTLFVRCLRANSKQQPGQFDSNLVREQLEKGGISQVLAAMKYGFPHRLEIKRFVESARQALDGQESLLRLKNSDLVAAILLSLGVSSASFKLGVTTIFLKHPLDPRLVADLRNPDWSKLDPLLISKCWKESVQQHRSHVAFLVALFIVRVRAAAQSTRRTRAAIRIQAVHRGSYCRSQLHAAQAKRRQAAQMIQAVYRGCACRRRLRAMQAQRDRAAKCIQTGYRDFQWRCRRQLDIDRAATRIQAAYRGFNCRGSFRRRSIGTPSTGIGENKDTPPPSASECEEESPKVAEAQDNVPARRAKPKKRYWRRKSRRQSPPTMHISHSLGVPDEWCNSRAYDPFSPLRMPVARGENGRKSRQII